MDKKIEDLTLLLMYMTSWEEQEIPSLPSARRCWKTFRFEIIDELEKKGFLTQGRKSNKSVYLTENGIKQAGKIKQQYKI